MSDQLLDCLEFRSQQSTRHLGENLPMVEATIEALDMIQHIGIQSEAALFEAAVPSWSQKIADLFGYETDFIERLMAQNATLMSVNECAHETKRIRKEVDLPLKDYIADVLRFRGLIQKETKMHLDDYDFLRNCSTSAEQKGNHPSAGKSKSDNASHAASCTTTRRLPASARGFAAEVLMMSDRLAMVMTTRP